VGSILWPQGSHRARLITIVVLVAALVRALIVSERLAVIEIVVPLGMVFLGRAWAGRTTVAWKRTLIRIVPLFAVVALIAGFTVYESSRSWPWYRDNTDQHGLVRFGTNRLIGYYSTSYSNAELLRQGVWPRPGALPFVTISGLWSAPGIQNWVPYENLTNESFNYRYAVALSAETNQEFNNYGGITAATLDYGMVGGYLFIALFGALVGAAYAAFSQARRWGVLFYPVIVIGLLELSRTFYLGLGRAVPAFIGLVYAAIRLRNARQRDAIAARRRAATIAPDAAPVVAPRI
jgi:hypothetical protein